MITDFIPVSEELFTKFVKEYPRKLTGDKCGISEPPLVTYSDFSAAKGFDAVVARYHDYPKHSGKRIYGIRKHLL